MNARPTVAPICFSWMAVGTLTVAAVGCSRGEANSQAVVRPKDSAGPNDLRVVQLWPVEDFEKEFVQFESVFWEPDDSISLRQLIRSSSLVEGKRVLEIGIGSGLISLCCLKHGADSVVATDINSAAVACAKYNADRMNFDTHLDVRQVSQSDPSAFSVIGEQETFDLIISNPPWEDAQPDSPTDHAFFDPGFQLLSSLMENVEEHLTPGGKCLLAYGCTDAIFEVQRLSERHGLVCRILDDRSPELLPKTFLPGMLLEITVGPR